jgi:hypothetical protein
MPELRKLEITARDVRKGDVLRRQGASDAKVTNVKIGTKKVQIFTDASDKPLVCEFIQPLAVHRLFLTKEERLENLRDRLREQLNEMLAAEDATLKKFIERAGKMPVKNALEWCGEDLVAASVNTSIAKEVYKAYDYHQRPDAASENPDKTWELEDCVIAVVNGKVDECLRYGRVDRSSNQMHNQLGLIEQEAILRHKYRGYSPYDTSEEIKAILEGIA